MQAPDFWERGFGPAPGLLAPLSLVWRAGGAVRRALVRPWRSPVPVICVGGLVVGGSGKTPVALALGALLQRWGRNVHFLARGYGGRLGRRRSGPARVDPERHGVADVGDEALLLAAQAPTWVARDRRAGARAAAQAGAEILVMDDGLQNPALVKDLAVMVVDGAYGFGNRRVIPAGPLREPIRQGLRRADVVLLLGENTSGVTATIPISMPVIRGELVPGPDSEDLARRSVVAFAGIGQPHKFFRTLEDIGCDVRARHAFPDHHLYTADEVAAIREEADSLHALPVTTAKDAVRLPETLRGTVRVLTVAFRCNDEGALVDLLEPILDHG